MSSHSAQTTDTILMIRPAAFGFNHETAVTNIFQQKNISFSPHHLSEKARTEFDEFVNMLRAHKIYVLIFQDPGIPETPDSIFPNNWLSFDQKEMIIYPMLAENRRRERRTEWVSLL